MKKRHIANLRLLYSIIDGLPDRKVDLDVVRHSPVQRRQEDVTDKMLLHGCGAVACLVGWASAHPTFKRQGVKFGPLGLEVDGLSEYESSGILDQASIRLFGVPDVFDGSKTHLPPRQEALQRLRQVLYDHDAITPERNAELERQEKRKFA